MVDVVCPRCLMKFLRQKRNETLNDDGDIETWGFGAAVEATKPPRSEIRGLTRSTFASGG